MKKKRMRLISIMIQCVYSAFCLFHILLCLIYRVTYDTDAGRLCLEVTLHMIFVLFMVPAMPVSMLLNIGARTVKNEQDPHRGRWLLWTVFSPVLYAVIWIIALGTWIWATGGI